MMIKWQSILVTDLRNGFTYRLDDFIGVNPRALELNQDEIEMHSVSQEVCYNDAPSRMLRAVDPASYQFGHSQFNRQAVIQRVERERGSRFDELPEHLCGEMEIDWWGFPSAWTRATGCTLDELPAHVLEMMLREAYREDWQVDVSEALDRNLEEGCDD